MTKSMRLQNLCCANCAAEIERKLKKLDGVKDVVLNFMTTKLTMEIDDGRSDEIIAAAEDIILKVEPEVEIKKA